MAETKSSGIFESVKTIVYALLIALVIRTVAFEPFNIPSGSMMPTLEIGDYLFVSKFSYGYSQHSLPLSLPLIPGRILFSEPERGDVAVFKLPSDNKTDYIKRIVGVPGDKIQVKYGRLHINGKTVSRRKIEDYLIQGNFGQNRKVTQYIETLPNGKTYAILEMSDQGPLDNTGVYIVPDNHYFAMGDNRDNSQDSRVHLRVGFIPKKNLVGRAEILFFSKNNTARWWEVWKWPDTIRANRFFKKII
ncbi:signal peptidase I [Rhodospirillales bacterium]|nr:signal peptidase I [Rhodospirillales bacterium]